MATQLFRSESVEEQWHGVVFPWLRDQAGEAWRDVRPTVVLTPSRAESFQLRGRWLREKRALFGVHFWTPSDARTFLLAENKHILPPATQPELRLAARAAAETLLAEKTAGEPSWKSVAREPEPFLRSYDLLLGAGWNPAREGAAYGRGLAAEFERRLRQAGVATQAGAHRALRENPGRPVVARLLVAGFNATHWPLWDLLRALVTRAEESTVSLLAPRKFGEEIDQLWIGSWEEAFGEVTDASGEKSAPAPFAPWIEAYERGVSAGWKEENVGFIASAELPAQVDAVVLQTLAWLREKSCERIGIVFPEADALSLGVAERLRQLGLPFDDGTGCWRPGLFERRAWPSWLALQEEPSVERLVAWARACEAEQRRWNLSGGTLDARDVADALDGALGETLIDDLPALRLYLEEASPKSRAPAVADFLREGEQLPARATFAEFFAATLRALERLGWQDHLARIESVAPAWLRPMNWTLSRRSFLEWLREAADSRAWEGSPEGNHFYGRIHLLTYARMAGQSWTHLLLTGLNEGRWPRLFENGAFGSRHELAELNRQARTLNRRVVRQGTQGEGHEVVREGHGHCLLPRERQDLALRDLCAAVEATSAGLCLAAMTQEAGRALLPSDFFTQAWQAKTGGVLDETAFRALATRTAEWCRKKRALLSAATNADAVAVEATRTAYAARRDETQPFGRYEFSYATPPAAPIQLSCKKWEDAWHHPSSIWLGEVVGVKAWPDGRGAWARARGTWVHAWLRDALRRTPEKSPAEFLRRLREASERQAGAVRDLAGRAGAELYPWWMHVWSQARAIALGLGEALAPALADHAVVAEFTLPSNLQAALPGSDQADFLLRGRIDLVLVDPGSAPFDPARPDFTGAACWIVDFKTGPARALQARRVEKGFGLQAMLYALAVRALGAEGIALSLQTFDAPLHPQVQIGEVLEATAFFHSLDRMHREGIFGMKPGADSEYGYAPEYPLATRPVPREILEAKWARAHGATSGEGEGE